MAPSRLVIDPPGFPNVVGQCDFCDRQVVDTMRKRFFCGQTLRPLDMRQDHTKMADHNQRFVFMGMDQARRLVFPKRRVSARGPWHLFLTTS